MPPITKKPPFQKLITSNDQDDDIVEDEAEDEAETETNKRNFGTLDEFTKWFGALSADEQIAIAKLNPNAAWAQPWLKLANDEAVAKAAAAAPATNASAEERFSKAAVSFMKNAHGLHDAEIRLFNVELDAFKKANPSSRMPIADFTDTDKGIELKKRVDDARVQLLNGPLEAYTKVLDDEFATLEAEITKQVEAFSIAHNAEPLDARHRLEKISPTFAALVKRQAEIPGERREQLVKCQAFAEQWRVAQIAEAQHAEEVERVERANKRLTPTERKFFERVDEIMKARNLERPAAVTWAIDNDDVAKALYAVTREERANGVQS